MQNSVPAIFTSIVPLIVTLRKQLCYAALILACSTSARAELMDRVLVIVNEDVITQSQFDYRLQTVIADMQQQGIEPPAKEELSQQLLDSMVSDLLQIQEVERRNISVTDAEVESSINRFTAQQGLTPAQFKASLLERGESYNRFVQTVRDSLNISRLTEYYARARVVVPDYEIDGWIAQNDIDDGGAEYQISHLLIKNPEQNAQLAQQVRDDIVAGMSFDAAVLTYSEAADAEDGGLLGWRSAAQLPEIFATAIKSIGVGEITEVLRSDNGLHILKLLDLKGTREEIVQHQVQHILITATTDVARAHAKGRLSEVRQRILGGESFEDLARIYSDDSVSAANGGGLGWVSPGEMVPAFEQTYNEVALNEISQPFDTNYGVHILQVVDRRTKNITDQLIRAQADNILRRQRTEREFQQWVRELREESYIEYVSEPA